MAHSSLLPDVQSAVPLSRARRHSPRARSCGVRAGIARRHDWRHHARRTHTAFLEPCIDLRVSIHSLRGVRQDLRNTRTTAAGRHPHDEVVQARDPGARRAGGCRGDGAGLGAVGGGDCPVDASRLRRTRLCDDDAARRTGSDVDSPWVPDRVVELLYEYPRHEPSVNLIERLHERYVKSRRVGALAASIAPLFPPEATVLDVGCGDGLLAEAMLRRRPDIRFRGIDVMARPDARITVTKFDGARLPFPQESFDVVLFADVLHHTPHAEALLRDARDVARHAVIVKDHCADGFLAWPTLRFMDRVGNARFGVALQIGRA